jgi:pyruvate/2-oxoglutarate dehydrogenase complex dihydrolipoamide acyltransferase (E2) component
LRVVGTPRALGEKLTLYEIAPGDTVMLAEQLKTELQSVVVTGLGQTRAMSVPATDRAAAKTAAPAQAPAPPAQAPAAAPVPAPAPAFQPSFREGADGTNTLIWNDPKTGNQIRLSGRHSRAELEQIRQRIERAKTAAADSLKRTR